MLALALLACRPDPAPPGDPSPLWDLPETRRFATPGLRAPAHVVFTAHGVPHVYAADRVDLARVQGFVVAKDRFFQMDLVRRLSTGRLSELLGDVVLETDLESRGLGMTFVTDLLLDGLTPAQRVEYTAYAEGFNDYLAAVRRGELDPPSEYAFAGPLVGVEDPIELMEPWTLRDVAAIGGTIAYRLGFETEDVGRSADRERLEGLFDDAPFAALRQAGAEQLWSDVRPVFDVPSAPGFGQHGAHRSVPLGRPARPARAERALLDRVHAKGDRIQARFGRDHQEGWGSNAWAVSGEHSADGRALLAGDGHLELDIPALMYPIGLDAEHLSGGAEPTRATGMLLVGMPVLGVGTNGAVAWSSTQHSGDITDWYAERVQLGADGRPEATFFQGEWRPIQVFPEVYRVADVPSLGSVGREETIDRFTTFDGRWLFDIEGRPGEPGQALGPGEALVNLAGSWVVPGDADGDGTITAISFDFTGFDPGNLFLQYDAYAHARDVADLHEATRKSQALSQNLVAADSAGDIFYTGYEMVPCRGYLPRAPGGWADGASPFLLLDGTTYGAFTIPVNPDFTADESSTDPYRCVVPFAEYPHSFTPDHGFLLTANQDPGGLESDGDLFDDPWHIGGPWDDGYRAEVIDRRLRESIEVGQAGVVAMQQLQGHHVSSVGRHHLGDLLASVERVRALVDPTDPSDQRALAAYQANQARVDEALARLAAWGDRGWWARSGVETFYQPTVSEEERQDAVATTIFNVWLGDLVRLAIDDEGFPGALFQGGGSAGRLRILDGLFAGRGPGNPRALASWDPEVEESVFWDVLDTPERERSDEVVLLALIAALDFLQGPGSGDEGGFDTPDMDAWLWGLRHQVEFRSLVSSYIDDPLLGPIFEQFAVNTDKLPLAESVPPGDPRRPLDWFPRPGDNRNIDASNPGLSGRSFRYGNGPVMRMVWALGPDGPEGYNVIPGGQSGLVDSENFSDQAELWLANETIPVPFGVEQVLESAEARWLFAPDPLPGRTR